MSRDYTGLKGCLGFIATIGIGEINHLVGICVGLLSAAYLIRKHVRLSKIEKEESDE